MTKLNPAETKYGQMAQNLRESMPDTANVPGSLAHRAIELLDQRHMEILAERTPNPKTLIEECIKMLDALLHPTNPFDYSFDSILISRGHAVRVLLALQRAKEQSDERS